MNAPNYNFKTLFIGKDVTMGDSGYIAADMDNLINLFRSGVHLMVAGESELDYINDLVVTLTINDGVEMFETINGVLIIPPES